MIFGGGEQDRTVDLLNAIQALSQLSYTPKFLQHNVCESVCGGIRSISVMPVEIVCIKYNKTTAPVNNFFQETRRQARIYMGAARSLPGLDNDFISFACQFEIPGCPGNQPSMGHWVLYLPHPFRPCIATCSVIETRPFKACEKLTIASPV